MDQYEIILKSPTDRVAPFKVQCLKSMSVKELKIQIKDVYPCKPNVETQKLIYCGKLLTDEQLLENIFESDKIVNVYFIYQSTINSNENLKPAVDNIEESKDTNLELFKDYQNYLNQYYSSMNQYQQFMQLNNAYMESHSSLYGQSSTTQNNVVTSSSVPSKEEVQSPVTNDTQNQENPPENERRAEPGGDNGVQNMMAAAFGGLMGDGGEDENDGEIEPRDFLHYIYMLIRFGLLLLICYYYSSMASVATTLLLFFLFFGVNLFRRNNRVNQQIEIQPPPENAQLPAAEEILENEAVEAEIASAPMPAPSPSPGMTDRLRRVASTSIQFVLTFFVTLFPDPVAHIDVRQ